MLKRAWAQGIDASYVLFDSRYAHDVLISKITDIGYGVICRLKAGQVKYTYPVYPQATVDASCKEGCPVDSRFSL